MAFKGGGMVIAWQDPAGAATGTRQIRAINPSTLSFAGESETFEAQGVPWSPGVVQTLASGEVSQTFSATLNVQKIGLSESELLLNTKAATPNIEVPTPFQTTIASNTATVTGLTEDEIVVVNISTEGQQQSLEQIAAAGTPTAGQFSVSADTLTFNTGEFTDGTQITGLSYDTVSTGNIIGGNSLSEGFGNLSFFCKLQNTQYSGDVLFYVQQMTVNTDFDFSLIGAAGDDISIPVTLSTPSGWNRPYALIYPAA